MLTDIQKGSGYVSGDSFIHRLDVKIKLIGTVILIAAVASAEDWKRLLIIAIFVFLLTVYSDIPLSIIAKKLHPFSWYFIFTAAMHLFFTPGESLPYFPFGFVNVTYDGMARGGIILSRLFFVILITSLLTLTTPPVRIAAGIEKLLAYFEKILPHTEDISSMIVLTFQFIPLLLSRAEEKIKEYNINNTAERRGLIEKIKRFSFLVDSYFESVLKEADEIIEQAVSKNV